MPDKINKKTQLKLHAENINMNYHVLCTIKNYMIAIDRTREKGLATPIELQ